MNRRDLIQRVLLGSTALIVIPSAFTSCTKEPEPDPDPGPGPGPGATTITIDLSLAANSALNTVGGSKIVQTIIVVNTGSGNFVALTSICTHEQNIIGYNSAAGKFRCPAHGSEFSITGSVLLGPAASSLRSYTITKADNILTITL